MAAALQILFTERQLRCERIFRDRTNPLDIYNDVEVIRRYRFPRDTILELVDRVAPMVEHPTGRSKAIPACIQVYLFLYNLLKF